MYIRSPDIGSYEGIGGKAANPKVVRQSQSGVKEAMLLQLLIDY
jgi:hypothetical protein